MRISDWSSDVCSSDLAIKVIILAGNGKNFSAGHDIGTPERDAHESFEREHLLPDHVEIGRASCRERVCQYVSISVVADSLKQTKYQQQTTTPNPTSYTHHVLYQFSSK